MTTLKQSAANKANALKSTGPKTVAGKAVVAGNAIRHGILSQRLFLDGENPAEFSDLQDQLRQALRPMGTLELALVEKIAVALWKQRRLIAAETSFIELGRDMRCASNRYAVKKAAGLDYTDDDVTEADLLRMSDEEQAQQVWCRQVVVEIERLQDEVVEGNDLIALAKVAPDVYRQLADEANEEGQSPEVYVATFHSGLAAWIDELRTWCAKTLRQLSRRHLVQSVAQLVHRQNSAPMANEVLIRYQVALDGELYRAMEALRRQQEFRNRLGIDIRDTVDVVS